MSADGDCEAKAQEAWALLQANSEALPWRERRDLVRALRERLQAGRIGPDELKLAHFLASDSRGEVRAEVAELLAFLPAHDFTALSAKLAKDDYVFAAHAAQRALARRRKGEDDRERRERILEGVEELYAKLVRKFGPDAAELALDLAERLYDTQVGDTMHALRPLLAFLRTRLDTMQKQADKGEGPRPEQIRKCSDLAAKLERHLEQLRDYARPVSKERLPEKLAGVLGEAEHRACAALKAAKKFPSDARIEKDVPDAIIVRLALEPMVVAFTNLIMNALEWLPKGTPGRVTIVARQTGGNVEVAVRDTGTGLRSQELEALRTFRPGRTTLKPDGNGFGLPQAHKTIKAHGGTITLTSKVGKGTSVTVVLPVGADDEET